MKKRRVIIGLVVIVLMIGSSLATYEESAQIDLGSGMIRNEHKALGLAFFRSSPEPTIISASLGGSEQPTRWLTVFNEELSFPRTRTNPCHPRMLHRFGVIAREVNSEEVSALTARLTLAELRETEDPCKLKGHLERYFYTLVISFDHSWDDTTINSEIPRIWKDTLTEQAAP